MVVQNQTSESQPELKNAARTRYGYRLGLVVAVASVLVSIALLPFALSSLFGAFHYSPSQPGFELSANTTLRSEWTILNIAAISMNEAPSR